jgi:lactoylglutathione lyase
MKKILVLLLVFSVTEYAYSQDTASYNFAFNHMALSVKDVDASAGFYKSVLKLDEITNRSKLDGVRWFSMGGGRELHLISIVKSDVTINKAVHLAMTTSNFEAFIESLDRLKIVYSDWPGTAHKINVRADGIKQVFFQDIDGYWIEVNSSASNDKELLKKLEYDWLAAEFKRDTAAIAAMMDDRFVSIGTAGISTKQKELDGMFSNISDRIKSKHIVDSLYLDDVQIQIHENTAIVTFVSITKGSIKGQPFKNRRTRIYDVWMKRNGQWKAVSSQITPLPADKRP